MGIQGNSLVPHSNNLDPDPLFLEINVDSRMFVVRIFVDWAEVRSPTELLAFDTLGFLTSAQPTALLSFSPYGLFLNSGIIKLNKNIYY